MKVFLKHSDLLDRREMRRHLRWFKEREEPLEKIECHNLVHGDLNAMNVIIRPDRQVCLIDFVQTHFGLFELDLAISDLSLEWDCAEAQALFYREYFQIMGEAAAERHRRHAPFFEAYALLTKTVTNAGKAHKVLAEGKSEKKPFAQKAEGFLTRLRNLIS